MEGKDGSFAVSEPRPSLVQFMKPEIADESRSRKVRPGKKAQQALEIIDSILPPREFTGPDGVPMVQRVSATPATREDVIALQRRLDDELQRRQARESGICPVREELYGQCLDELIRHIALESAERGLLMARVRDEVRMTISAYVTLYQSSITFGMRKSLQAEQGNSALLAKIEALEADKRRLYAQVQDQRALYDAIERRIAEQRAVEDKRMQEEKDFLRYQQKELSKMTAP